MKKMVCDKCGEMEDAEYGGTGIYRLHVTGNVLTWAGTENPVQDFDGYIDLCDDCYSELVEGLREEED
jgi:hypothetical protein